MVKKNNRLAKIVQVCGKTVNIARLHPQMVASGSPPKEGVDVTV